MESTHTSGEMFFHSTRLGSIGRKLCQEVGEDFWSFLEIQSKGTSDNSEAVQIIGEKSQTILRLQVLHQARSSWINIEMRKKQTMYALDQLCGIFSKELSQLQQRLDGRFMQLVLQYSSILQQEMHESRRQLQFERHDKSQALRQAAIIRDIQVFACHIKLESQSNIVLTSLSPDSAQFDRCAKAVRDNLPQDEFCSVLGVFKLNNIFLSRSLQSASDRLTTGKIKGLFCVLPIEHFFRFCVFGLHCQTPDNLPSLADQFLHSPWFSSQSPQTQTGRRMSTAKLDDIGLLRFRRHSGGLSSSGSVLVCLCRVLVLQQLTVDGDEGVTEEQVKEARRLHYDALFCSKTEEYVLLQSDFVLPEFFMLVQSSSTTTSHEEEMEVNRLPAMLRSTGIEMLKLGDESLWDLLVHNNNNNNNNNDNNNNSPRSNLMRKQQLVMSLRESVLDDFRKQRLRLLKKYRKAVDRLVGL